MSFTERQRASVGSRGYGSSRHSDSTHSGSACSLLPRVWSLLSERLLGRCSAPVRTLQDPVRATGWGFNSPLAHPPTHPLYNVGTACDGPQWPELRARTDLRIRAVGQVAVPLRHREVPAGHETRGWPAPWPMGRASATVPGNHDRNAADPRQSTGASEPDQPPTRETDDRRDSGAPAPRRVDARWGRVG
jgi:hypothetical protein